MIHLRRSTLALAALEAATSAACVPAGVRGATSASVAASAQKLTLDLQDALANADYDRADRVLHERCDDPVKKEELGAYAPTFCSQYKAAVKQQRAMARYSSDSDEDGTADAFDRCPGVKGTPMFVGCRTAQEMSGASAAPGGAVGSAAAGGGLATMPAVPGSPAPTPAPLPSRTFVAAAPQPSAYALIIGIERYRDVPEATGASSDALGFADMARQTLGLRPDHVRVASDDHATKNDIVAGLDWLVRSAPPGGRVYFYFSGHGAPNASDQSAYLLPYDGDPRDVDASAVPLAYVMRRLGEARTRDALAFVDSCFSGAGGRSVLPAGARPLIRVRDAAPAAHLALFSASGGDEISGTAHGERGGAFTKYLLQGLGTGRADVNGDGQVGLDELSAWVSPRVAQDAQLDRRSQHPRLVMGGSAGDPSSFIVEYGLATP